MIVVDLFAGPGGWDLGAALLGFEPLGVELDDAACATRRAAGLRTLQADVAALEPWDVVRDEFGADAALDGLIASPPCQAFSMAGKGAGRKALSAYLAAIGWMGAGRPVPGDYLDEQCSDERAHLVLEPLRWALELRPRWVALEQVEPVLPLWEAVAMALRAKGYSVWTGVLSAERFGVPQTRRRAVLLASLEREVVEPVATHQRYVAPRRLEEASLGLFDAPEPERIVLPEDRGLVPWVSMAEALGWDSSERVGFPRLNDRVSDEQPRVVDPDGKYRARDLRRGSQPAFALTEKTRSWIRFRANAQANSAVRGADEPAPTITGGHDTGDRVWVEHLSDAGWPERRPATTLAGDARVFPPGGHLANDGRDNSRMVGRPEGAVRVSAEEAALLQSFPADYPWQGTKTKVFVQIGNAVPPVLAFAALEAVVS